MSSFKHSQATVLNRETARQREGAVAAGGKKVGGQFGAQIFIGGVPVQISGNPERVAAYQEALQQARYYDLAGEILGVDDVATRLKTKESLATANALISDEIKNSANQNDYIAVLADQAGYDPTDPNTNTDDFPVMSGVSRFYDAEQYATVDQAFSDSGLTPDKNLEAFDKVFTEMTDNIYMRDFALGTDEETFSNSVLIIEEAEGAMAGIDEDNPAYAAVMKDGEKLAELQNALAVAGLYGAIREKWEAYSPKPIPKEGPNGVKQLFRNADSIKVENHTRWNSEGQMTGTGWSTDRRPVGETKADGSVNAGDSWTPGIDGAHIKTRQDLNGDILVTTYHDNGRPASELRYKVENFPRFQDTKDPGARRYALENPKLNADFLNEAARTIIEGRADGLERKDGIALENIVKHPNVSPRLLNNLAEISDDGLIFRIMESKNITPEVVGNIVQMFGEDSEDRFIRAQRAVAEFRYPQPNRSPEQREEDLTNARAAVRYAQNVDAVMAKGLSYMSTNKVDSIAGLSYNTLDAAVEGFMGGVEKLRDELREGETLWGAAA
ncbi:hypothetical protein [Leifsonia sp. Leaf264]|uniref:hypothetical protein n=1 Tax=Leifsonia sp. Leaf264 TaxID=1736314 RepID=UPI0007016597|nr:hypothetical protein [Leifsonia sp. Leaf264]KQO98682.1 hypothetical protein ASF30_11510 [Leifsonia sp. Leaf264]